jgi:16S rRNA (cytidine1402-2'-O)-methyltransferase
LKKWENISMNPNSDVGGPAQAAGPALYIVATPIGNLDDVTLRALAVLRACDFIVCEDTRQTRKLLVRHGIEKELTSTHRFNEEKNAGRIIRRLEGGESAVYATDGGTPAVSDPGARLVERVRRAGFPVVAVPGASAVTAAVSIAGWEGGFVFAGFVEKKRTARLQQLETLSRLPWASVLFESPARVRATLADMREVLGDREVLLAREMTKLHEQVLKAPPGEVLEALPEHVRGEVTLAMFPPPGGRRETAAAGTNMKSILKACRDMTACGMKPSKAAAVAALLSGIPKRTIWGFLQRKP